MTMAANKKAAAESEVLVGVGSWMMCSMGMLVFNKQAIVAFPEECTLTALQMAVSAVALLLFGFRSIHIGSLKDVARWAGVAPFFTGMLLTSILALKNAPMTLVITFRSLSPLFSLAVERFYPNPITITKSMLGSIALMVSGAVIYTSQLDHSSLAGIQWVFLNMIFAVVDRLLQRLMLSKDQNPVDISKTGCTLLNNALGLVPLLLAVFATGEFRRVPEAVAALDAWGKTYVILTCIVGLGISYTGIWAQSLISATSFLVLVNANKFFIIFLEAYVMKTKNLTPVQIAGATISIIGGIAYGKARQAVEASEDEKKKLLDAPETQPKSP